MARYKETEISQGLIIPVILSDQLVKGTFEYTLERLIDKKMDLSIFDRKYNNDYTDAKAISPKILLKIITYSWRGFNTPLYRAIMMSIKPESNSL